MAKLTISAELFDKLTPSASRSVLFQKGNEVKIISLDEEKEFDWGNNNVKVPGLNVEIDGTPSVIPLPVILNAIVNNPEKPLIHNEGKGMLECVDHVGNTLHDSLRSKAQEGKDIELPQKLTVMRRVNKGVPTAQIEQKQSLYPKSNFFDADNFAEISKDCEFMPSLFENATGAIRTHAGYVVAALS